MASIAKPVFDWPLHADKRLHQAIREGLSSAVIDEVMSAAQLTLNELAATLHLSPRTLQRRRRRKRLFPLESDRMYRLVRIMAMAKRHLGDEETAIDWLKSHNRALGGARPIDMLDTEVGARSVENVLGRIAYGGVS